MAYLIFSLCFVEFWPNWLPPLLYLESRYLLSVIRAMCFFTSSESLKKNIFLPIPHWRKRIFFPQIPGKYLLYLTGQSCDTCQSQNKLQGPYGHVCQLAYQEKETSWRYTHTHTHTHMSQGIDWHYGEMVGQANRLETLMGDNTIVLQLNFFFLWKPHFLLSRIFI